MTATPELFDGEVLLQDHWTIEDGVYKARYIAVRYSAFLAWRDFGAPGQPMRNGFAMAALQASDGAFLLGRMGQGTANPGKVYFAAGTPDRNDIVNGQVDLAGNVLRELCEETGLRAEELSIEERWTLVSEPTRAAYMRPVRIDMPASAARCPDAGSHLPLEEKELSDIVIVRSRADLDPAVMRRSRSPISRRFCCRNDAFSLTGSRSAASGAPPHLSCLLPARSAL